MKTLFAISVLLVWSVSNGTLETIAQPRLSTSGTVRPSTTGIISATNGTIIPSVTTTVTTVTTTITTTTLPSTVMTLFLSFNSHNEENDFTTFPATLYSADSYENSTVFSTLRTHVKEIADIIRAGGAKWDWQSDWRFLMGTLINDPNRSGLRGDISTNYKTIVRWLAEETGGAVHVSPHAHENDYNYADVAHLFDSLNVTPDPVVGGFTYNAAQATNGGTMTGYTWDALASGLQGRMYPWATWTPSILFGGASVNARGMTDHANDIRSIGIWKPESPTNFFTHAAANTLTVVGNGYTNLLTDTTSAETVVATIVATLDSVRHYGAGKLYSASIGIHQKYFTSSGYAVKIRQIISQLAPYVASGQIQWASHTEKVALWNSPTYRSTPNFAPYTEGYTPSSSTIAPTRSRSITTGTMTMTTSVSLRAYPNPASSTVNVSFSGVPSSATSVSARLLTSFGAEVASQSLSPTASGTTFDVSSLTNASYIVEVRADAAIARTTIIVTH